jgi:hypothetical protein
MKKRKNTAQSDAGAEANLVGRARDSGDVASANDHVGEIPSVASPGIADAPSATVDVPRPQTAPEAAGTRAQPHARHERPVLPRVAILGAPPSSALRGTSGHTQSAGTAAGVATERRPRRFALLAACVALSAGLGALGGSLAVAEIGHLLAPPPPPPPPTQADASEEIRALKDAVAQLRASLKSIGDNVAAVRSGLSAAFSSSTAQVAKLTEAIEKLERHQAERHAGVPQTQALDATGSIAAAPAPAGKPAKPGVVDGWVLRKAYRGAALVEGRYGILEIEAGDHLPGVGRVEEIKRQDGRWVVVTAKGLILPVQ